jgi:alpha-beta hydrolase superfamily lysophospholipase
MVPFESLRIRFSDQYEAYARWWQPVRPRGAVLYLHGIQSHGLWFETSARRLAEAGLAVLLPDRRGSGRNDADRGHLPSAKRLLTDLSECLTEIHVRTGFTRAHLVGMSWGGKLALAFFRYLPGRVASLALVAPGLFPKVDLTVFQKIRVVWSAVTRSSTLFPIPLQAPELFTANPDRQAFIRSDSLALHNVTSGFLRASRRLDRIAHCAARAAEQCPLRLFLAEHDRIIDNHKTRDLVRGLNWPQRDIIEYQGAHHTLEFEPDPEPFLRDLINWIALQPVEQPPAASAQTRTIESGLPRRPGDTERSGKWRIEN